MSGLPVSTSGFDGGGRYNYPTNHKTSAESDATAEAQMPTEQEHPPRPSANDPLPHIVNCLIAFSVADDKEFSKKACESLVKKLKDRREVLDAFIEVVYTRGRNPSICVTQYRTNDGRLQVAGKKGFPHLTYFKVFRCPDTLRHEIKSLPCCQFHFDAKNSDSKQKIPVCVNPWHYERTAPTKPDTNEEIHPSTMNQPRRQVPVNPVPRRLEVPEVRYFYPKAPPANGESRQPSMPWWQQVENQILPRPRPPTADYIPDLQLVIPHELMNVKMKPQKGENINRIADILRKNNKYKIESGAINWATLAYFEKTNKISQFQATMSFVSVGCVPSAGCQDRWCLETGNAFLQDRDYIQVRNLIGQGVMLTCQDNGDVEIEVNCCVPVYVQTHYLDRECGREPGDAIHRINPGGRIKIFDLNRSRRYMEDEIKQLTKEEICMKETEISTEMEEEYIDVVGDDNCNQETQQKTMEEFLRYCVVRISFKMGWGPDFKDRESITDCPCWVELKINKAYEFLENRWKRALESANAE